MWVRDPTIEDVAKLLLFAPEEVRRELELSRENIDEWIADYEWMTDPGGAGGNFMFHQLLAFGLFYAFRATANLLNTHLVSFASQISISAMTIHALIGLASVEEFANTKGLIRDIKKNKDRMAQIGLNDAHHASSRAANDAAKGQWLKKIKGKWKSKREEAKQICKWLQGSKMWSPTQEVAERWIDKWRKEEQK